MLIYNVTVKINTEIAQEWMNWMRTHHIPKVLETGCFAKCRISKLDIQEADGETFAIQYDCFSQEVLNKYMSLYAPALQKEHIDRYAGKFVAFRTTLQVIEELFPKLS
ncbi:MAG: DUF4286 family protein [Saprospiraceae bacterium]|nr:DUF4286 family protein [Saprospiraceae bacterium]